MLTAVLREDFNVPIKDGVILSTARIKASLLTIEHYLKNYERIILISHLGRPEEGVRDPKFSLQPVADCLSAMLGLKVALAEDFALINQLTNKVILLENIRFFQGEESNSKTLGQQLAALGSIYVLDAFACMHRDHASIVAACQYSKKAVAGKLLAAELMALDKALKQSTGYKLAIIGGSKVSTKLAILKNLLPKMDKIIVGGGIANTFLKAQGVDIKASLYEPELVPLCQELLLSDKIIVPTSYSWHNDKIMDAELSAIDNYQPYIMQANTIIWNGPLGVFEEAQFAKGTLKLIQCLAQSKAFKLAGGGETIAALEKAQAMASMSYVSTGGAAFLEYLEGRVFSAIQYLQPN